MFKFDEFLNYSLCDPSPSNDEDSSESIEGMLEPIPNPFNSTWCTDTEESVRSTSMEDSSLGRPPQFTTPSLVETVWVEDLIGSSESFPPPAYYNLKTTPASVLNLRPFDRDSQMPVNVKESRCMESWTGKMHIFSPEDDDYACVLYY